MDKEKKKITVHVQYKDLHYDYVGPWFLDRLIARERLIRFYRPSEEKWIDVYGDSIRGTGGSYSGPERRHQDNKAS